MTHDLQGKVVAVTGAASGIGGAIAEALVTAGAVAVGIDRDEAPHIIAADVVDPDAVAAAIETVFARHGRLDGLVNNAGICPPGTVIDTPLDVWERCFAVNVRGVYLCSRAAIPLMMRGGGGAIVHMASNYGLVGGRSAAAYSASKGAVVSLTRAMALDHAADGIRVNCVCPGTIDTPLVRRPMACMSPEEAAAVTVSRHQRHPLGRIGRAEEVAPAVLYLLGDGASFITGTALSVDGGYTAQ